MRKGIREHGEEVGVLIPGKSGSVAPGWLRVTFLGKVCEYFKDWTFRKWRLGSKPHWIDWWNPVAGVGAAPLAPRLCMKVSSEYEAFVAWAGIGEEIKV